MNTNLKARRTGGKGTPRIPPKKQSHDTIPVTNKILSSFKKNTVGVPLQGAFFNENDVVSEIKKPEFNAITGGNKLPVAYFLRGKRQIFDVGQIKGVPDDFEKAVEEMKADHQHDGECCSNANKSDKHGAECCEEEMKADHHDGECCSGSINSDRHGGECCEEELCGDHQHESTSIGGIINASDNGELMKEHKKEVKLSDVEIKQRKIMHEAEQKFDIKSLDEEVGEVTEIEDPEKTEKKIKEVYGEESVKGCCKKADKK